MDTRGVDPLAGEPSPDDWPAGRPYPTRPYPTRPYPTRPYPTRPYPTRPYGAAQGAWRPYPTRPYPTRPYPTREEDVLLGSPDGGLEADEWTTDVSALFLSRSAVVRLGARLLVGEGRIPVPRLQGGEPEYLPGEPEPPPSDLAPRDEPAEEPAEPDGEPTEKGADATEPSSWPVQAGAEKSPVYAELGSLIPSRNELALKVVLPDTLARDIAEQPEPAWGIKEDIADALAVRADRAMLTGIRALKHRRVKAAGPAAGLRPMLATVADAMRSSFRDAGWILPPDTLDALREEMMGDRTWDSTQLLIADGEDGGLLLGYPFVATKAAGAFIYFSGDWSEVWIGMRRRVVTVDISKHAQFQSDETVIRAVSQHDLIVRRPELFATADG